MKRLVVAPIVEGHGEVAAMRILLQRVWTEIIGGEYIDVLRPYREGKDRLLVNKDDSLCRAVRLAHNKLHEYGPPSDPAMILIVLDADKHRPCQIGPDLLAEARQCGVTTPISCVIATVEYETWFVAAAESLSAYLNIDDNTPISTSPESESLGKGWIRAKYRGARYSETIDQPRLTAKMDLGLCRSRSPSFDKLCREFEKLRT